MLAIDTVLSIAPAQILEVEGFNYIDKGTRVELFRPPMPEPIHIHKLDGLPLRMRSAHYGLLENFAGFAAAAALAQSIAPNNEQLINLLGLHVISKVFLYYPTYVFGLASPLRTLSHIFATSAVINVCWKLASGAA